MEWFRGTSSKPMVLYTNAVWLDELRNMKLDRVESCTPLAVIKPNMFGELKRYGGAGLKASQAYTLEFGQAVAELWLKHRRLWRKGQPVIVDCVRCSAECPSVDVLLTGVPGDPWADACLGGVLVQAEQAARNVCSTLRTTTID
jgi:hypothetical protein